MALRLAQDPGRFLSTVQIGITLVGVLSGAFSGATLGSRLSVWLHEQGLSAGLADGLGVGSVVVAITYISLIIGELVPKQIALRDAELVAARVAPAMVLLSKLSLPLVWVLDGSGKFILRLLGQKGVREGKMTDEEIKTIIAEAESAGVIESEEKEMISGVMRLADRTAKALLTPRPDVEAIDLSDSLEEILAQVRKTRRSRLPVQDGSIDTIVGVVYAKDVLEEFAGNAPRLDLKGLIQPAPIVSENARALDVLRAIRETSVHMALVFDEYGHFEGIVTAGDILEAITGVFQVENAEEPAFVRRENGSFLVSGWMPIDEFADKIGGAVERDADYQTIAGFVIDAMGRLPEVGEVMVRKSWRFEIVDLDGRRIDKLLVSREQT